MMFVLFFKWKCAENWKTLKLVENLVLTKKNLKIQKRTQDKNKEKKPNSSLFAI